jgi:hypothetical protein
MAIVQCFSASDGVLNTLCEYIERFVLFVVAANNDNFRTVWAVVGDSGECRGAGGTRGVPNWENIFVSASDGRVIYDIEQLAVTCRVGVFSTGLSCIDRLGSELVFQLAHGIHGRLDPSGHGKRRGSRRL